MKGRRLGNFEIGDRLGVGAWGTVYEAQQLSLNRKVAVKVLREEWSEHETAPQRFLREAEAMARLKHANIAGVIDVGQEDGTYFFAMDFLQGKTLAAVISAQGHVAPDQIAEWGAQIADALAHAHSRGVVHRDIKPANIIIVDGRPVVTDFGIAKLDEAPDLTTTGVSLGTANYMAPEQMSANWDARVDLYALGCVLYEMATGSVPFPGNTTEEVVRRHREEYPRDPRLLRADCPEWLTTTIMRALEKRPEDRFASAAEMANALRRREVVPRQTQEMAFGTYTPPAPVGPAQTPVPGSLTSARGSNTQTVVIISLVIVLLTLVLAGVALLVFGGGKPPDPPPPPPMVAIPSVVGLTWDAAVDALRGASLQPRRGAEQHDSRDKGTVIAQAPTAGGMAGQWSTVELTVSLGVKPPDTTIVPSVIGMVESDARECLGGSNLTANFGPSRHGSRPAGVVISQSPSSGVTLDENSSVRLTLSLGPETPPTPPDEADEETPVPPSVEDQVTKVVREFHRAVVAHDANRGLACFTSRATGKPARKEFWDDEKGYGKTVMSEPRRFRSFSSSGSKARIICDIYYRDRGETGEQVATHLYEFRRIGGQWKISKKGTPP